MREKSSYFPAVLLAESLVPGGHPGVADARRDGVIDVPLGVVERMQNDLRHRRVEGMLQRAGLVVEGAVADGAIHGVDLHAVDKIVVGGWKGIVDPRGMTVHGGVESTHGDAHF